MTQPNQIEELFERIRKEVRRLRGQNRFRGNEYYFQARGLIRIPLENRKSKMEAGYFVIHAQKGEAELWAEEVPRGECLYLRDFEMDLGKFIEAVVDRSRGSGYLHTNAQTATYRKPKSGKDAARN